MDERVIRFRVGVVVVAAVMITVILVMLFGAWPTVLQSQYELHVKFPEAPGINVDTPVRKSGVLIGRVSKVRLLDEGGVVVSAKIYDKYTLRKNETCRVGTASLIGDAVLEFVPSGEAELLARFDASGDGELSREEQLASQEPMADGDFMSEGLVASNPLEVLTSLEGTLDSAFSSVEVAGTEVSQLARSLNSSMGDDEGQLLRIMKKTETALDRFDSTMQAFEAVLGDKETIGQLKDSLRELPEMVQASRETMDKANAAFDAIQSAAQKADARLDDIAGLTEPLRDNGPQMAEHVLSITRNLDGITSDIQVFTQAMNSQQGTLSRLIHDDELFQKIDGIVTNAEEISQRIRPIVEDVRIFTDKIARDPRQLGVKGALDRRPSGLKTGVVR
jgi:phospholipid/cholesterol/gamma-HCH transport system substrate-binding protein